ncbi:MAG: ribose-5-phosphate isomerase [Anaerolineae bacterium]
MHIAIGADHAGFRLKGEIAQLLERLGHTYQDCGAHTFDAGDDYPDFARAVAEAVTKGECERGILVCGNGIGVTIAANKVPGVRAALCHDTFSAHQSREHDNANVLCLGERVIGPGLALEIVETWLAAQFSGEERHRRRLEKIRRMEEEGKSDHAHRH